MDYARDSTQLWMEVLMRCFVGGPIMSVTCIGVIHGHSRLQPNGFGSLVECMRSWLVRRGFGRLPSSLYLIEFGSLRTTTDCGSFWGTPLGVADCGHGNLFSRVDYQVMAYSQRDEQTLVQQRSISILIKGCRIKRRPKEDMKVWSESVVEVLGMFNCYYNVPCNAFLF